MEPGLGIQDAERNCSRKRGYIGLVTSVGPSTRLKTGPSTGTMAWIHGLVGDASSGDRMPTETAVIYVFYFH